MTANITWIFLFIATPQSRAQFYHQQPKLVAESGFLWSWLTETLTFLTIVLRNKERMTHMKVLTHKQELCTGCRECELACSRAYFKTDDRNYSAIRIVENNLTYKARM